MTTIPRLIVLSLVAGLAACGSTTTPIAPCCYTGPAAVVRLEQLVIETRSGQRLNIRKALPGFKPQEGFITRSLPFQEVHGEDIIYASLEPLLPLYDANANGTLETPEVIMLYLREALRGMGVQVRRIGAPAPARALILPAADIGGLVGFVQANRVRMNPTARHVFADLELLGNDLLSRGSEGGGENQGKDFIN